MQWLRNCDPYGSDEKGDPTKNIGKELDVAVAMPTTPSQRPALRRRGGLRKTPETLPSFEIPRRPVLAIPAHWRAGPQPAGRNPGEAGWARIYPLDGNYDDRGAPGCGPGARALGRWRGALRRPNNLARAGLQQLARAQKMHRSLIKPAACRRNSAKRGRPRPSVAKGRKAGA
jgi:hypothetical protein